MTSCAAREKTNAPDLRLGQGRKIRGTTLIPHAVSGMRSSASNKALAVNEAIRPTLLVSVRAGGSGTSIHQKPSRRFAPTTGSLSGTAWSYSLPRLWGRYCIDCIGRAGVCQEAEGGEFLGQGGGRGRNTGSGRDVISFFYLAIGRPSYAI